MKKILLLFLSGFCLSVVGVNAQKVALKSNLLYDATTTLNLGVEVGLGQLTTLDISGNYNPWTFSDNQKMKHWLIQPEFRIWTCERFNGHFFGIHAHYAQFNIGGMLPFGIKTENFESHRYDGWLAGAGVSYGYQWILSNRWSLEATIGVGYAYIDYNKYQCGECGDKLAEKSRHYFGPTKAGVTLIFMIK